MSELGKKYEELYKKDARALKEDALKELSAYDKEQAKKTMLWGVVAIFVMASVWGLVSFIGSSFGIGPGTVPSGSGLVPH